MRKITFLLLIILTALLVPSTPAFAQSEPRTPVVEKDIDNTPDPVASLREQIEAAPNAAERNRLRMKLADLLLTTGHKSEALAEFNSIANSNSFDPIGFYNLGNALARLGNSEAAISAYQTAIEQRKGKYSRAYNNMGVLLLRAGRWDEAYNALISALKVENFRYAEASYNLGRLYSARGQNDLAAREWRRALHVDPQHDGATQALARAGTEGRVEVKPQPVKAVRQVNDSAAESKSPQPVAVSMKSPASAGPSAASSSKSLTLDQASFNFLQRARDASENGKMSEAVENYRRVLSREDGYFAPANLELGFALLSLKRYDEALAALLEVNKRDGARYPISYFHVARLYELKGELKLAEAAFLQAAPSNAQFLLDVCRVREKLGDYKGSLEVMERYLKLMQDQGEKPAWSDERLAELRTKASKQD